MTPRSFINLAVSFAAGSILCCGAFAQPTSVERPEAEEPVYEVYDYTRGLKITTFSEDWSYSPLSRHKISMIHNPGFSSLELDTAFSQKNSVEESLQNYLENERKNENSEILSDRLTLTVGDVEATGFSFIVLKSKEKFVRGWFKKGERLYEVELQADEDDYDIFLKAAEKVLANVEFIEQ